MKKIWLWLFAILLCGNSMASIPDEGMWLPMFIKDYNYSDMQKLGLKLTPQQLYDINNSSLKDAIVQLGDGFCTGEIVSRDGLMFTNHHCGYSYVVGHSTEEHDYLKNGFWAMKKSEELPNEGLFVNFLVRMEDVTKIVLDSIDANTVEQQREKLIHKRIQKLTKDNSEKGKYKVVIKPFYEENEYYMFVYITYNDVRLVGAPPAGVGKFGGDTDNWMWPRHTGDFTIFRIYTAPDGSPASYSPDNVPLQPKHFLPISLKGIEKGDFTMVWGYPGSTERFMTSFEVNNQINIFNPPIVDAFNATLPVIRDAMNNDTKTLLDYADDYAGNANFWKNKEGETASLIKLKVADKKAQQEKQLQEWINQDPKRVEKYGTILADIQKACESYNASAIKSMTYFQIGLMTSNMSLLPPKFYSLKPTNGEKNFTEEQINTALLKYQKLTEKVNFELETKVLTAYIKLLKTLPADYQPDLFATIDKSFKGDINLYVQDIAKRSFFMSENSFANYLNKPSVKKFDNDPLVQFFVSINKAMMNASNKIGDSEDKLSTLRRSYLAALKEMETKAMYPDANSTMRMSYGQVLDYYPVDGVHYKYFTTHQGILEKEIPGDPEFEIPDRLRTLLLNKDFGKYGTNGILPVCFLSNNDITGGNSGSPVMNAEGQLVGIAFDGNWEALSSDIVFNSELQRCINVDIRYVLFIIDKYAGAGYLLDEMTLIQ